MAGHKNGSGHNKNKRFKGGKKKLSSKVSKVRRDDPSLSAKQAVGKAAGILRARKKKRKA